MKNIMPEDDRELISFVQRHRPLPPKANPYLESNLIEAIRQEPQSSNRSLTGMLWAVPGTIAMGLVIGWGSQGIVKPSPQIAEEIDILESFIVNNWEATTQNSYFSVSPEPQISEMYQLFSTVESPQVISTTSVK